MIYASFYNLDLICSSSKADTCIIKYKGYLLLLRVINIIKYMDNTESIDPDLMIFMY
jgi:hypothetical protein